MDTKCIWYGRVTTDTILCLSFTFIMTNLMYGDHHARAQFRIWISHRVKIQLVAPVLQHTAVPLTAPLDTISTDIIAHIVPSTDSSNSSSSEYRFISWLLTTHGLESAQSQERPYHVDRTTSRLLCKVEGRWARVVLRWGTTWEALVLFLFCLHQRS